MKKHHRHPNGRAIKWVDSRFAGPYRKRRAWALCLCATIQSATHMQLNIIRSTAAPTLNKKIATVEAIKAAYQAIGETLDAAKTAETWAAYHSKNRAPTPAAPPIR